jgi:hypothetical protein
MNSREVVRRTLDYEIPERVARSFNDSDLVWCSSSVKTHATEWKEIRKGKWERIDEWGNLWSRVDPTSMGEVVKGVLQDLSDLSSMELPDYSRPEDYECVRKERSETPDKWLIGFMPGFTFSIARKMLKLERYLVNILAERDLVHRLHDRIDFMLEHMIHNYAVAGVDSVMFADDWGTQEQTLISPEIWHEEFFPRYKGLCAVAHQSGTRIFMHSCGKIGKIVPGLMEAGIDLLQFDQPDLHGIDSLAEHQKNARITFWCPVDIQKTLQTRNEKIIRGKAREMLDKLWKGRGGFIAGYYNDNRSIGLDPKWQKCASDEFIKHGIRSNYTA